MALILCPECQHEVSTQATTCPNCGYPLQPLQQTQHVPDPEIAYLIEQEQQRQKRRENRQIAAVIYAVIILVLIIILVANLSANQTPQYHTCTTGDFSVGSSSSSSLIPIGTPCP